MWGELAGIDLYSLCQSVSLKEKQKSEGNYSLLLRNDNCGHTGVIAVYRTIETLSLESG